MQVHDWEHSQMPFFLSPTLLIISDSISAEGP